MQQLTAEGVGWRRLFGSALCGSTDEKPQALGLFSVNLKRREVCRH
jgi:hypothetical protein